MRLTDACELFITESSRVNTDASRLRVRAIVRQLASYCGDRTLDSYTLDELTGFCLGHGGRGTAPNTIETRTVIVRSLWGWCHYRKVARSNPAAALQYTVKVSGGNTREHTWLTEAEIDEITSGFNLEDPRQHRDRTLFRTVLMLGLRRSEAAAVRWQHFRPDFATVRVLGKGRKLAELPVPKSLRADLDVWRVSQPTDAVPWPRTRWVIDVAGTPRLRVEWTRPLGSNGVYQLVRSACERAGHPGVAPHDLRRSFAGILETKGVKLRDIQHLMRHDNLATTDRYLSNSPARLAKVVDGIEWG